MERRYRPIKSGQEMKYKELTVKVLLLPLYHVLQTPPPLRLHPHRVPVMCGEVHVCYVNVLGVVSAGVVSAGVHRSINCQNAQEK